MHSKKCTNCGHDNDLLLTNCLFCKSSLPTIDLNSITNEVLVMNTGQWIGKLKEGFYIVKAENSNAWTGRGERAVFKAEIQGYALQYLTLIHVRSVSNINLNHIYQDLKSQYDANVASDDFLTKRRKLGFKIVLIYFAFSLIVITLYILMT